MTYYWKFVDTLVLNVATISAFIVGVTQFLIRSYKENDGANKVRKGVNKTLFFVNKFTSVVYEYVNQNVIETPVKEEVKVTEKRTRTRKRVTA